MHDPEQVARHHRWLKWFWIATFPVCAALYLMAPDKVTLLYLALVSVYANVAGEAGAEIAAVHLERGGKG